MDVNRFLFRPRWIAFHLLCIAGVVAMVMLSLWQFDRLAERKDFNRDVRSRSDAPIVDVSDLDLGDPSSVEWRSAGATGTYVPSEQILILNRSQDGRAGVNVVTPLLLADGRLLAVTRGFIGLADTPPPAPTGTVEVLGVLRASETRRTGQPTEADGRLTEMFRLDLDRLDEQIDADVLDVSLSMIASDPVDDPILRPVPPPSLSEGSHLSYAIQWLIFATCVVIGWNLAVRRSMKRARSAALDQ
jgi:cytochrome oxidase assembly protein ShyY1